MFKKFLAAILFGLSLVASCAANAQATPYVYKSAASTNSTLIGAGARSLYYLSIINTTATIYYLRLYDSAVAPTCSSATGVVHNFPIPASTTGAGIALALGQTGALFQTGLGFCITGGDANNDNTSAATGVTLNIGYR